MASQLNNMMAEIESWESATEFGIPEDLWAGDQVRQRSDDLYIAVLNNNDSGNRQNLVLLLASKALNIDIPEFKAIKLDDEKIKAMMEPMWLIMNHSALYHLKMAMFIRNETMVKNS